MGSETGGRDEGLADKRMFDGHRAHLSSHLSGFSLGAPPDEPEAAQLRELYARARALVEEKRPDQFALRVSEIQGSTKRAAIAHRGEGTVLAAAGQTRDLPVTTWVRASLVRPAGLTRGTSVEVADALCARLDRVPGDSEQKQAAAAAVAVLVDAGVL